jgi:regulation of enolase protein 1 (concanavalin A-like superfamily)
MLLRICTLLVLLMAYAALAAPAPKDGWEQLNPDKDGKIDIKDGTVTIELPGRDHEIEPKRNRFNAPCVLRDVEGDFAIQVRVSASFRPSGKSSVKGESPRVAAGLLLIPAEKNYVRLEYGAIQQNGKQITGFSNRMRGEKLGVTGDYTHWNPQEWKPNQEHIYLRIEREGDWIRNVLSPDGKTWERYNSWTGRKLPSKFKVGLAAYSTSTEPFKVRFDHFKLIQGQKKKQ